MPDTISPSDAVEGDTVVAGGVKYTYAGDGRVHHVEVKDGRLDLIESNVEDLDFTDPGDGFYRGSDPSPVHKTETATAPKPTRGPSFLENVYTLLDRVSGPVWAVIVVVAVTVTAWATATFYRPEPGHPKPPPPSDFEIDLPSDPSWPGALNTVPRRSDFAAVLGPDAAMESTTSDPEKSRRAHPEVVCGAQAGDIGFSENMPRSFRRDVYTTPDRRASVAVAGFGSAEDALVASESLFLAGLACENQASTTHVLNRAEYRVTGAVANQVSVRVEYTRDNVPCVSRHGLVDRSVVLVDVCSAQDAGRIADTLFADTANRVYRFA